MSSIGSIDENKKEIETVKDIMKDLLPKIEHLSLISSEMSTLQTANAKIVQAQEEDKDILKSLLQNIEENNSVLQLNVAALQNRVDALKSRS